jgi:acetate kinase
MAILALNAGSSTLKFALFDSAAGASLWRGKVDLAAATLQLHGAAAPFALGGRAPIDLHGACAAVFAVMAESGLPMPQCVVHRVVHGGIRFRAPYWLDDAVVAELTALTPLAPLHQPASLAAIDAARTRFSQARHLACFDTAFHSRWPDAARRLALPRRLHEQGVQRFGFHGLAHMHAARVLRREAPQARRAVVAHLGSGASLCALADFDSVDASMGYSALDGLPMATRCGAIDPGVLLHLLQGLGMTAAQVEALLYRESGMLGVSGISGDMRTLLASETHEARQAIELFVHHVVRGIGAMAATLGGLDALLFSGGIGEHAASIRAAVCARLAFLGIAIDADANHLRMAQIHAHTSRVVVHIVACDEEALMAEAAAAALVA